MSYTSIRRERTPGSKLAATWARSNGVVCRLIVFMHLSDKLLQNLPIESNPHPASRHDEWSRRRVFFKPGRTQVLFKYVSL